MSIKPTIIALILILFSSTAQCLENDPVKIIDKLNNNFKKIKDATADIKLDTSLFIFGCSGINRLAGKGFYKYPDKIKASINGDTYFAQGNRIRRVDKKGVGYIVTLINAPDLSVGFHPGLIPHNFNLNLLKNTSEEVVIEGLPKPGVLKNAKKVIFYIDPKEWLLRKLDVIFPNRLLSGKIEIDYRKIDGIWVPTGFHGHTAFEIYSGALVGFGIKLQGENIKINSGLIDPIFNPGF